MKQSQSLNRIFFAKRDNGFTLIEMIVSLAIFSIVAVVALGALMKIISANKKAQSLQSAMTNINYALESISREMRVGSDYYCNNGYAYVDGQYSPHPCQNGYRETDATQDGTGATIAFKSSKVDDSIPNHDPCNIKTAYIFKENETADGWDIEKATQTTGNGCTQRLGPGGVEFASIIDKNVIITGYFVRVTAGTYPLAVIRLSGYVGVREQERTYFDVETAVSSRISGTQDSI